MQSIQYLTMDLARRMPQLPLDAVQGDGNTRILQMTLLENGKSWAVPAGVTAAVAFRKPDGTKGMYDTLPDGTKAVTMEGNTVTAVLAHQALTCPGEVSAAVVFHDGKLNQLATFPFVIRVKGNPAGGQGISNDYYRYSTMEEACEAVEAALAQVRQAVAESTPPILCEGSGRSIAVTDAAQRPIRGLSLYGRTLQNGTPTPGAPVPLESLSERIAVTIQGPAEVQTITAAAPGGLGGIPVSGGGNYTDERGQGWICDEIDFARGVYVRRTKTLTLDGGSGEEWNTYTYSANLYTVSIPDIKYQADRYQKPYVLCEQYFTTTQNVAFKDYNAAIPNFVNIQGIAFINQNVADLEQFRALLAESPVTVVYALAQPVETPLSAEELAAFAALHTYQPNTTVFSDSGAGMKLSYVADTKAYIDNRITAISKAMIG